MPKNEEATGEDLPKIGREEEVQKNDCDQTPVGNFMGDPIGSPCEPKNLNAKMTK